MGQAGATSAVVDALVRSRNSADTVMHACVAIVHMAAENSKGSEIGGRVRKREREEGRGRLREKLAIQAKIFSIFIFTSIILLFSRLLCAIFSLSFSLYSVFFYPLSVFPSLPSLPPFSFPHLSLSPSLSDLSTTAVARTLASPAASETIQGLSEIITLALRGAAAFLFHSFILFSSFLFLFSLLPFIYINIYKSS